jgi:hypothetical protein
MMKKSINQKLSFILFIKIEQNDYLRDTNAKQAENIVKCFEDVKIDAKVISLRKPKHGLTNLKIAYERG